MAGRSQSTLGNGRGGRGGQGNSGRGTGANGGFKKKDEKKLKQFHPQTRGKAPDYSFEEVKKELVKALEASSLEKADNIINSVRRMELLDLNTQMPTMQVSQLQDEQARAMEQEQF